MIPWNIFIFKFLSTYYLHKISIIRFFSRYSIAQIKHKKKHLLLLNRREYLLIIHLLKSSTVYNFYKSHVGIILP